MTAARVAPGFEFRNSYTIGRAEHTIERADFAGQIELQSAVKLRLETFVCQREPAFHD
jgi:hypothetical protein